MHPRSRYMFLVMVIVCLGFAILADQGRIPETLTFFKYYAFVAGILLGILLILERMFRDKE